MFGFPFKEQLINEQVISMVGLGFIPAFQPFVVTAGRHKSYVAQQSD
jgi:hypothetical protein